MKDAVQQPEKQSMRRFSFADNMEKRQARRQARREKRMGGNVRVSATLHSKIIPPSTFSAGHGNQAAKRQSENERLFEEKSATMSEATAETHRPGGAPTINQDNHMQSFREAVSNASNLPIPAVVDPNTPKATLILKEILSS